MGGSAADALASLILKKEIDAEAARVAGLNSALSAVILSEREFGERRALIGESMVKRVIPAAQHYRAITIAFESPFDFERELDPQEFVLYYAYNFGWVIGLRIEDFIIFDIGRDRSREEVSNFYLVERIAVAGYYNHREVPWD